MVCPLCGQRSARRACPALGQKICAACCGTKRLVQIQCPSDCAYLAAAREHPPAAKVRQQERQFASLVRAMRDLNERQSRLFSLIVTFLARYKAPELHSFVDDDVVEAMAALGATFETAVRGLIYEHRPTSLSAERLVGGLKPLLAEAGQTGGTGFQRDAAVVFRRIEAATRDGTDPSNRKAFIELAGRLTQADREPGQPEEDAGAPRIIIP